jgi:hypothetical protein
MDPSPMPFSPFSSSSRRRKLRGTAKLRQKLKLEDAAAYQLWSFPGKLTPEQMME